jgi:hypothetical protein
MNKRESVRPPAEVARRRRTRALGAATVERTFACARPLIDQLAQAFEHASRLDKNIAPVRITEAQKRAPADKGRGTVVMQKTAVMLKPAAVEPSRRIEKVVIGGGADSRFNR